MKRNLLLAAALLSCIININAQTIKGKVVNITNQPIDYATVVLQTTDSVYINSTITDTLGIFEIKSELAEYRLVLQHLLYETKEVESANLKSDIVVLDEKEYGLGEIVVKGERPVVKVVDGKLTYDMVRLLEGKVESNAYEAILQIPGMTEQSGSLVLAGANNITVIINGRPTTMTTEQLSNVLRNMPQSRIEKAEVMYSAPPQYQVRGAVINLVLKKGDSDTPAFQVQVNSEYIQRYYGNFTTGATVLYHSPKFSSDFLYTFSRNKTRSGTDLNSLHTLNDSIHHIEQHNSGYNDVYTHNIRWGGDYNISPKNKIGLVYTSQITPTGDRNEISIGNFSNSITWKKLEAPTQMHNLIMDYNSGFGLNFGVDYTYYRASSSQDFRDMNAQEKETSFISYTNQEINRLNTYLNQTHSLPNEWTLNYGGEFTYATDKNSQKYRLKAGNDLPNLSSNSKLNEYTYSMYGGFDKSFTDKFSVSAYLSGEYYKQDNIKEWTLFPSAEITYAFSPSHILQMAMSSDKTYPSYWAINSSVAYLNGYAEIHGNPLLRPYKDYSTQLSYIIKSKYTITAYYSYMDDYFVQLPYQSSERLALIYKTTNLDYKQVAGVNVVIPFKIGGFSNSRITVNGFYNKVKSSHFHDLSFSNENWVLFSRFDNAINISSKPNIKMELSGAYMTPNIQGPIRMNTLWNVDAGIKWTFASNNAELRVKGTDLLNTWSPDMIMKYANQNLMMNMKPDSRAITISFSYRFGGYKDKDRKAVDTSRFGGQ